MAQFESFGILPCQLVAVTFAVLAAMFMLDDHADEATTLMAVLTFVASGVLFGIGIAAKTGHSSRLGQSKWWSPVVAACMITLVRAPARRWPALAHR